MKITTLYERDITLAPDLVWDGQTADFAIAAAGETGNRGGLQATQALRTALIMCLMTDRAVANSELPEGIENRGWPGDAISLDPAKAAKPLGSKLWLLRWKPCTDATARQAEIWALEALQSLVDQGAAAKATASAAPYPTDRMMTLEVALYRRDGSRIVAEKFDLLWRQTVVL